MKDGSHVLLKGAGLRRGLSTWPNAFLLSGEIWKFAINNESAQPPELICYRKTGRLSSLGSSPASGQEAYSVFQSFLSLVWWHEWAWS